MFTIQLDMTITSSNPTPSIRHQELFAKQIYGNGSFVFYVDLFLSFLYYWQNFYQFSLCVTRRLSYMKKKLLIIRDHLELTPGIRWGLSCSSYFLCCIFVLFVLFFVLWPALKVSLVAPFGVPKCSFHRYLWIGHSIPPPFFFLFFSFPWLRNM